MLIRTLLLGALVPEVPALHSLTASRLHALNFGSITAPVPGYENQMVIDRLSKLAGDAGGLRRSEGPDPAFSLTLSSVDYDRLLEFVPDAETGTGVVQQIIRELVSDDLGIGSGDGVFGDQPVQRDWRGRRHQMTVKFGNVRDRNSMPDAALYAEGQNWRIVIDYPFDVQGQTRNSDMARIEQLDRGSHTVFWLPLFFTDEVMSKVRQLAKIDFLLGRGGTGDRINTYASDWSAVDRQQGKLYLQQRQGQLRGSLRDSLKQAYGVTRGAHLSDVESDTVPVLHTLAEGLPLGDLRGGTLKDAFDGLTADLLRWSYPGKPALPDDERPLQRAELTKVLTHARAAASDESRSTEVKDSADKTALRRICNPLRLGEIVENKYALTMSTFPWGQDLKQGAAKLGHTDRFPVHVLRALLDQPAPRGYDRELQNLIIALFALEQQLAWFQHGTKIEITSLQAISDQMELRHPPMPDEDAWRRGVQRGKPMFGKALPEWRSPATVAEFAVAVRGEASRYASPAEVLVKELTDHAQILGLDPDARSGRLATGRRVAKLLRELAAETDDVVVVGLVAEAEVGNIDDAAAGTAFKQAGRVTEALARTGWPLLRAIESRAGHDEEAKVILEELRTSAGYDQQSSDLVAALDTAVRKATALLAREKPTTTPPDVQPPVAPKLTPTAHVHDVVDVAALDGVVADIRSEVAAGRVVRVTWEVLP